MKFLQFLLEQVETNQKFKFIEIMDSEIAINAYEGAYDAGSYDSPPDGDPPHITDIKIGHIAYHLSYGEPSYYFVITNLTIEINEEDSITNTEVDQRYSKLFIENIVEQIKKNNFEFVQSEDEKAVNLTPYQKNELIQFVQTDADFIKYTYHEISREQNLKYLEPEGRDYDGNDDYDYGDSRH